MNQSLQSIPSRRRKCCRCNVNGVNARCKSCACAKAGRACNDCLPSKHGCCHNYTTSITASSNRTANDFSSSQPLPQHTSSFPDSQQLPLSQPLSQLPPSSTPSSFITPSPGSLVAHPFDSQNQLHVSALIREPKSPGQGPSFLQAPISPLMNSSSNNPWPLPPSVGHNLQLVASATPQVLVAHLVSVVERGTHV